MALIIKKSYKIANVPLILTLRTVKFSCREMNFASIDANICSVTLIRRGFASSLDSIFLVFFENSIYMDKIGRLKGD